jgi:hypothetical protein
MFKLVRSGLIYEQNISLNQAKSRLLEGEERGKTERPRSHENAQ